MKIVHGKTILSKLVIMTKFKESKYMCLKCGITSSNKYILCNPVSI